MSASVTPEQWRAVGEAVGPMVIAGLAWWEAHKGKKESRKAKEFAEPTGNGFARQVTDALDRIEDKQGSQSKDLKRVKKRVRRLENNESAPNSEAP